MVWSNRYCRYHSVQAQECQRQDFLLVGLIAALAKLEPISDVSTDIAQTKQKVVATFDGDSREPLTIEGEEPHPSAPPRQVKALTVPTSSRTFE
jgi:hypothetical protein